MKPRRTTEKQRRELMAAYYASGLKTVTFCKSNSLNTKTFYRWLKLYSGDSSSNIKTLAKPSFVPIIVGDSCNFHNVESSNVNSSKVTPITFKTDNFNLEFPLDKDKNIPEFMVVLQALRDISV
jgi:hypothetical protein